MMRTPLVVLFYLLWVVAAWAVPQQSGGDGSPVLAHLPAGHVATVHMGTHPAAPAPPAAPVVPPAPPAPPAPAVPVVPVVPVVPAVSDEVSVPKGEVGPATGPQHVPCDCKKGPDGLFHCHCDAHHSAPVKTAHNPPAAEVVTPPEPKLLPPSPPPGPPEPPPPDPPFPVKKDVPSNDAKVAHVHLNTKPSKKEDGAKAQQQESDTPTEAVVPNNRADGQPAEDAGSTMMDGKTVLGDLENPEDRKALLAMQQQTKDSQKQASDEFARVESGPTARGPTTSAKAPPNIMSVDHKGNPKTLAEAKKSQSTAIHSSEVGPASSVAQHPPPKHMDEPGTGTTLSQDASGASKPSDAEMDVAQTVLGSLQPVAGNGEEGAEGEGQAQGGGGAEGAEGAVQGEGEGEAEGAQGEGEGAQGGGGAEGAEGAVQGEGEGEAEGAQGGGEGEAEGAQGEGEGEAEAEGAQGAEEAQTQGEGEGEAEGAQGGGEGEAEGAQGEGEGEGEAEGAQGAEEAQTQGGAEGAQGEGEGEAEGAQGEGEGAQGEGEAEAQTQAEAEAQPQEVQGEGEATSQANLAQAEVGHKLNCECVRDAKTGLFKCDCPGGVPSVPSSSAGSEAKAEFAQDLPTQPLPPSPDVNQAPPFYPWYRGGAAPSASPAPIALKATLVDLEPWKSHVGKPPPPPPHGMYRPEWPSNWGPSQNEQNRLGAEAQAPPWWPKEKAYPPPGALCVENEPKAHRNVLPPIGGRRKAVAAPIVAENATSSSETLLQSDDSTTITPPPPARDSITAQDEDNNKDDFAMMGRMERKRYVDEHSNRDEHVEERAEVGEKDVETKTESTVKPEEKQEQAHPRHHHHKTKHHPRKRHAREEDEDDEDEEENEDDEEEEDDEEDEDYSRPAKTKHRRHRTYDEDDDEEDEYGDDGYDDEEDEDEYEEDEDDDEEGRRKSHHKKSRKRHSRKDAEPDDMFADFF